jgi:uncharacterized membrane protein
MGDEPKNNNLPADIEPRARPPSGSLPDEKRDAVIRVARQMSRFHSGPLPDPASLRAYARLIPDGAQRIMEFVEDASRHRHAQEARLVECETRRVTRGQWMAFVLTLCLTSAGLYLGVAGHDWLAAGLFTTTIGAVVTIFVLGNRGRTGNEGKPSSSVEA